jgi:hypothetical protein
MALSLTHEHACPCGRKIPCGHAPTTAECPVQDWKCREHAKKGHCPWCNGYGTYIRATLGPVDLEEVPCKACLGTGVPA